MKKIICGLLALIMTAMCLPGFALAAEYCALPDIASANGYEYIYVPEKKTANLRNASYILAFQSGNSIAAYKTVLGDQGTIELDTKVADTDGKLSVSKTDLQTKLVKYFPNLPDSSYTTDEKQSETTDDSYQTNTSAPSDWAVNEINSAIASGLITGAVRSNYRAYITREQFCELVIKLYDKSDGSYPANIGKQFSDTSNTSVLKACGLGIVYGVSDTEFAPYDNITRQEICAMLVRAIGVIYPNIDLSDFQYHYFDDINSISSWAMDAVQFAYDNGIIQGVGSNQILPRGNTTCEQAVLLINRIYENRSMFKTKNAKDVIETLKHLDFDDDDELNSVSVSFSDNRDASGVKIKEIKPSSLIYSTTGIKGTGVNISCSDDFDKATITFDYKPEALGKTSPSDLAVAWYNTDLNRIEVLDSTVNAGNHTVSVETTHFSEYILVDSKEWYSIWQRGQTIVRKTDSSGNNAENFNVRLVVDCSGSMNGDRINRAKECTYAFIQKLSADDKFSLIRFSGSAKTIISPTEVKNADMDSVKNTVMSMTAGGGTNFDAALDECINSLDSGAEYNNIIVFLSDGESSVNDSRLEKLNDNNVRIASVALGGASGINVMKKLSDSTSGQYVYAESSADLDAIYSAIQGSLIGVDATDSDGDGLPDMVEITGMKNRFGKIIRTDPNKYDTDGDGKSDGEEMGRLIETDRVTDMDKKHGINKNVYFEMVSNPLDGVDENDIPRDVSDTAAVSAAVKEVNESDGKIKVTFDFNVRNNDAKNIEIEITGNDDLSSVWVFVIDESYEYKDDDIRAVSSSTDNKDIFKINKLPKGTHQKQITMSCQKCADGSECDEVHKIGIKISGDNFKEINTEATCTASNIGRIALLISGYDSSPEGIQSFDSSVEYMSQTLNYAPFEIHRFRMNDNSRYMEYSELSDLLDETFSDTTSNDVSVFYYCGHSIHGGNNRRPMFAVNGAGGFTGKNELALTNFITFRQLYDLIDKKIRGTVILIYDGCFAGELTNLDNLNSRIKILAACSADEESSDAYLTAIKGGLWEQFKNTFLGAKDRCSVFAYVFYEGLINKARTVDSDKDYIITLNELYSYVQNRVDEIAGNLNISQHTQAFPAPDSTQIYYIQ